MFLGGSYTGTNVFCRFTDKYTSLFVSARRLSSSGGTKQLILQIICSDVVRFIMWQMLGVSFFFCCCFSFSKQVQVSRDAVYKCDDDGKQLVQQPFSVTSILWINLSQVLSSGPPGRLLSASRR